MADIHVHDHADEVEEVTIVTLTDEQGQEKDFEEYARLEVDGKNFALLDEVTDTEDGESVIARIDQEDEQEVYVAPTDKEFTVAQAAFEKLFAEE